MTNAKRIFWLDAAKAYGMFLVFYGHFVERIFQSGDNQAALVQDRLIYAFHMPLFIFLSGFLADKIPRQLGAFLKKGLLTRLLPVVFFSALMIPPRAIEHALPPDVDQFSTQFKSHWIDDWGQLCRRLAPDGQSEESRPRSQIWLRLEGKVQETLLSGAKSDSLGHLEQLRILNGLNEIVVHRDLFDLADISYITDGRAARTLLARGAETMSADDIKRLNVTLVWAALFPEWSGDSSFWGELLEDLDFFVPGGFPLNVPVWFLIALFIVEFYHFLLGRFFVGRFRLLVGVVGLWFVGAYINHDVPVWSDIFFARECVLLYAVFLLGLLGARSGMIDMLSPVGKWVLLGVGAAALLGTFQLNPGSPVGTPVVLINLSQHGNPYLFAIGALGGCFATVGLSLLTPARGWVSWLGSNTLVLMGCNGFFFSFVNWSLAKALAISDHPLPVMLWCVLVTSGCLLLSVPVVWLLNRYVPQLVGRPQQAGPLLPRLL